MMLHRGPLQVVVDPLGEKQSPMCSGFGAAKNAKTWIRGWPLRLVFNTTSATATSPPKVELARKTSRTHSSREFAHGPHQPPMLEKLRRQSARSSSRQS